MTVLAAVRRRTRFDTAWLQDNGVYVALVGILVIDLALNPSFVSPGSLRTQLIQVVPVIIVSLGMALVIGTEGIDLSVGAVMALATALLPLYLGYGVVGGVLVALAIGVAVGALNGWLVAVIGVQPIVATLALLVGGRGLANVIGGAQKDIHDRTLIDFGGGQLVGIPDIVILAAVLAALVAFLVRRTTFGRQLVAVGGNRVASQLAGLPVRRVLITVYVLSGLLAAIAGVVATARLQASTPDQLGLNIELSAITAVVVGGTPLSGGRVRILGTVTGAFLMQLIQSTLISENLKDSVTQMVQAGIIIAAVYVQRSRQT
ncbi:MAG: ABC transporter permease [Actinomycetota bacterium]|nr:ABC transporter permease [Actinomycetota bacterium]